MNGTLFGTFLPGLRSRSPFFKNFGPTAPYFFRLKFHNLAQPKHPAAVYPKGVEMSKSSSASKPSAPTPMTAAAASRIQGATARQNGGQVARNTFAARAQRAAALKGADK
jgi:hypothetical protein